MKEDKKLHLTLVGEKEREPYQTACVICGNNTSSLTKKCNPCWQCENRLEEYLKHAKGREHVNDILLRMYADDL